MSDTSLNSRSAVLYLNFMKNVLSDALFVDHPHATCRALPDQTWSFDDKAFAHQAPSPDKYVADLNDIHHTFKALAISLEEVQANFRRYGLLDEQVRFLKGWFKDRLPMAPIEHLAVLRLDGDLYESTIQALEALYGKLSPGGFVIIDDYFLPPCAQAVHDFRNARGITDLIIDIDGSGSYWRRSM